MCKSSSNSGSPDIKAALTAQRKRLKIGLWRERAEYHYGLTAPRCIYCMGAMPAVGQVVMHEWLIKRNYLPVKLQHLIMHKYNCVLADYSCHDKHGQTTAFKIHSARAQYKRYGREKIVAWVESLELRQTVWVPTTEEVSEGHL